MTFLTAIKKETVFFLNNLLDKSYVNIIEIMNEEIRKFIYKVFSLCKKISELSSYKNNS